MEPTPDLAPEELDRAGARMVRMAMVALGRVPLPEMTQAEADFAFRLAVRNTANDDDFDDTPDDGP